MLELIIVVLIILWLLGYVVPVSFRGAGNFVHILLVIVLVLVVIRLLQ
jgi:hypothetical protein